MESVLVDIMIMLGTRGYTPRPWTCTPDAAPPEEKTDDMIFIQNTLPLAIADWLRAGVTGWACRALGDRAFTRATPRGTNPILTRVLRHWNRSWDTIPLDDHNAQCVLVHTKK